jgi:hypothetical protein
MLIDVVVIVLVLLLIGAFPAWPHSRNWGYGPSGGIGVIVALLIILLVLHVI